MNKQKKIDKLDKKYFNTLIKVGSEKQYSRCGNYHIISTLGKGAYAEVKLAVDNNGEQVAIKVFKQSQNKSAIINALVNEIKILKELDHPNILKLLAYDESMVYQEENNEEEQRACIILELVSGGELYDYIAYTHRFSEGTCRYFSSQLIGALAYLHRNNIVHRDLKLENILLDLEFNLKIVDFGFASKVVDGELSKIILGTQGYQAPEMLSGLHYDTKKADIFAAGVVMFIIYTGHPPFIEATSSDKFYSLIIQNKINKFWYHHAENLKNFKFFSFDFIDLIIGMIQYDPGQRFSIEQILNHPWWTKGPEKSFDSIKEEFKQRKTFIEDSISINLKQKRIKELTIRDQQEQKNNKVLNTGIGKF